jgi:hypothetical protein
MVGYCSTEFYCNDVGSHSMCCPQHIMPAECESYYGPSKPSSSTARTATSPTPVTPGDSKLSGSAAGSSETTTLSTGAKAGIGVGVAVAGLVLIVLSVCFLLRRRRLKPPTGSSAPYIDNKAELAATARETYARSGKDAEGTLPEVSGVGKPVEAGNDARYELEGAWHGYEAQNAVRPT